MQISELFVQFSIEHYFFTISILESLQKKARDSFTKSSIAFFSKAFFKTYWFPSSNDFFFPRLMIHLKPLCTFLFWRQMTLLRHSWWKWEFHPKFVELFLNKSSSFFISSILIFAFIIAHWFSNTFKSGEFAGQCKSPDKKVLFVLKKLLYKMTDTLTNQLDAAFS